MKKFVSKNIHETLGDRRIKSIAMLAVGLNKYCSILLYEGQLFSLEKLVYLKW